MTASVRLTRRFYRRDPVTLAKALLGKILVVRRLEDGRELAGRIVEVEAYLGIEDRAAHSFGGRRTARNASMLGGRRPRLRLIRPTAQWCFNVLWSTGKKEVPTARLRRALSRLEGLEKMRRSTWPQWRRGGLLLRPGTLTQALGIDRTPDGSDSVRSEELFISQTRTHPRNEGAKWGQIWRAVRPRSGPQCI